jgi:hypothetical protein
VPFREAVLRCSGQVVGSTDGNSAISDATSELLQPLLAPGERYYLRSVGKDPRKNVSDFAVLFPDLAPECRLVPSQSNSAPLVDPAAYHSSVLRLASPDTQLWTHFDIMDNALAQVVGRKRVVLWPPDEDENLYVEGSSSRVPDVDRWNDDEFPLFRRSVARRLECELGPGDVLFLPALWFHNVTSKDFSVAINVFWRSHLDHLDKGVAVAHQDMYDAKDLYVPLPPPHSTEGQHPLSTPPSALTSSLTSSLTFLLGMGTVILPLRHSHWTKPPLPLPS